MKFTTSKTILAKLSKTIPNFNELDVLIEIGDAMKVFEIPEIMEDVVAFLPVKDYVAQLPTDYKQTVQVLRDTKYNKLVNNYCVVSSDSNNSCQDCEQDCVFDADSTADEILSSSCNCTDERDETYYSPILKAFLLDSKTFVALPNISGRFVPIIKSEAKFFGNNDIYKKAQEIYGKIPEYKIIDNKIIRLSFKEGYIAVAYRRIKKDDEGFPLIPDNYSVRTAITYYVMWKLAERNVWAGRQGFERVAQNAEAHWLKYVSQAKASLKMPQDIDDLENLYRDTHHIIKNDDYNTLK